MRDFSAPISLREDPDRAPTAIGDRRRDRFFLSRQRSRPARDDDRSCAICASGREQRINFSFANKLQREFSPLFAKRVLPEWQANTARQLPNLVPQSCVDEFKAVQAENVADFCLEMYRHLGLLEGMRVKRSGDPEFRRRACADGRLFRRCELRR